MNFDVKKLIERGIERGLDREIIKEAIYLSENTECLKESFTLKDLIVNLSDDVKLRRLLSAIKQRTTQVVPGGGITMDGKELSKYQVEEILSRKLQRPLNKHVLDTILNFFYE